MSLRRLSCLLGLAACTLLFPIQTAWCQVVYGNIVGTVTDTSGAAVPSAKVTVTNVGQGVNFNTMSNSSGNYEQTHLIPGTYKVRVEKQGFQAYIQENISVAADTTTQVNAVLKVGAVTQEITVTGEVPLLQTSRTDVSTVFTTRDVVQLPILNRNFTQFELLTPGTARLPWQHAASEVPQGDIQIMVNGQHFSGTGYLLDGTDNQDPILGIAVIKPNLDAANEMKFITADYDAEFGKATAGILSVQTKSGTNEMHGSGFYYWRNDSTTARDGFTQSVVPPSSWKLFGGSIGGPVRKDKTFYFFDYEGARRSLGGSNLARVPTAAERAGDLSLLLAASSGNQIYNPFDASGNVLPPGSRTAYTNNMITSALSSQAQFLLDPANNFIPLPNFNLPPYANATDALTPNFRASGNQIFDNDGIDVRIDQYQTEKLHMFGRYTRQNFSRHGPGLFGLEAGGPALNVDPSLGGFAGISSVLNHSLAYGFDYTLNSNWLTDFRFGWMRYRVFVDPNGKGTHPATDAGIPNLNFASDPFTSGMPAFFINGSAGFDFGYSLGTNQCNCPLNEQEMQYQFVNNWTHMRGNHTIKWGADYRYALNLRVPSDTHRAGELSFNPDFTSGSAGNGLGLASFLLGGVSQFGRYVSNVTDAAERQNREFYYGQDTWRVTSKLTVNYGLRWELYFPQYVNGANKGGWVQSATGEVWIAGTPGIGMNGNVQMLYGGLAPRLGVAYQLNPRTVIRMGYGRSFDLGTFGTLFGHTVTQNLPVLANEQLNPANSWQDVFTLAQGPGVFDPTTALVNNCNAITNPTGTLTTCLGATGRPLLPDGVSPHIHPKVQRVPTVDAWNVTFQHAFANNLSAEVAYVGNKGTHYFNGDGPNYDLNEPTLVGFPALSTIERKPYFPRYGWTQGLNYYGNDASNSFESLQAKVEKRFSQSYSMLAHYTFAHANGYSGSYFPINASVVYGPQDFQRNNAFVLTHIVQLPFGHGRRYLSGASRAMDLAVGGWQFDGSWTVSSGLPFTPAYAECSPFDEDVGVCKPDVVGSISFPKTRSQWYTPAAAGGLAAPLGVCSTADCVTSGPWGRPAIATFGNAKWNGYRGPGFWQSDLSLLKNFKVSEKFTAQFRAESFNAFNHVNLGNPDGCVDCGTGGLINGLIGGAFMRQFQFALRLEF